MCIYSTENNGDKIINQNVGKTPQNEYEYFKEIYSCIREENYAKKEYWVKELLSFYDTNGEHEKSKLLCQELNTFL